MAQLQTLQSKRRDRVAQRKKHYGKYERFNKTGKKLRRNYQLRKFRQQLKAIRKLDKLIRAEVDRQTEARKINWSGCPSLTYEPLLKTVRLALNVADGLYITATTNGTHSPTSWHYSGHAVDFGSNGSRGESPEMEAQQALLDQFGAGYFAELFGPCRWYVKNGIVYSGTFPGHGDHLHVGVA